MIFSLLGGARLCRDASFEKSKNQLQEAFDAEGASTNERLESEMQMKRHERNHAKLTEGTNESMD